MFTPVENVKDINRFEYSGWTGKESAPQVFVFVGPVYYLCVVRVQTRLCRRGDSNPHARLGTTPSRWRVYQIPPLRQKTTMAGKKPIQLSDAPGRCQCLSDVFCAKTSLCFLSFPFLTRRWLGIRRGRRVRFPLRGLRCGRLLLDGRHLISDRRALPCTRRQVGQGQ